MGIDKLQVNIHILFSSPDAITQSKSNAKPNEKVKVKASPMTQPNHKESRHRKNKLEGYNRKRKENDEGAKSYEHSSDFITNHEDDESSVQNRHSNSNQQQNTVKFSNSQPSDATDGFSKSQKSGMPPANLSLNRSSSGLKFKNWTSTTKRNSAGSPDDIRPGNNIPSKISPPCANLCQGKNFPSRPPPPPLPDKEIVENVFTNNPHLVNALGRGHKTFHQHLTAALKRNSTDTFQAEKESLTTFPPSVSASKQRNNTQGDLSLILNEGFTGRIVFRDPNHISDERSDLYSEGNLDRREGQQTDFKLQGGNMAESDQGERRNKHEDKIGYHMAMHSNALQLSVSASFFLDVLCFSVIVMFMR